MQSCHNDPTELVFPSNLDWGNSQMSERKPQPETVAEAPGGYQFI